MSEENLFADQGEERQEIPVPLFEIGDRKYDAEAARKKIESADEHIKRIEAENAEIRASLQKAKTLEDVLSAMQSKQEQAPETPAPKTDNIAELVEAALSNAEQKRKQENNILSADTYMKQTYGEKAKEVLQKKATELGLGITTMMDIASKSPVAFKELFKESSQQQQPASTNQNPHRTEAVPTGEPKEGTYAWYAKVRKENPTLYNSQAMQRRMLEDADRLGKEAFFS